MMENLILHPTRQSPMTEHGKFVRREKCFQGDGKRVSHSKLKNRHDFPSPASF